MTWLRWEIGMQMRPTASITKYKQHTRTHACLAYLESLTNYCNISPFISKYQKNIKCKIFKKKFD